MALITTERLEMREATRSDAAFMLALLNDPGFIANIGDRGVRTIADAEAYIEARLRASYAAHGFGMYVVELHDGVPIGLCGFVARPGLDHPDLGYALIAAETGKRYGREAAAAMLRHGRETLGLETILAIAAPGNAASLGLLRSLGFRGEELVVLPNVDGRSVLLRYSSDGG